MYKGCRGGDWLWVYFFKVQPINGVVKDSPFGLQKHICPLVETSSDDVGALSQGDKFAQPKVLIFGCVKTKDKVSGRKSVWADLLVK